MIDFDINGKWFSYAQWLRAFSPARWRFIKNPALARRIIKNIVGDELQEYKPNIKLFAYNNNYYLIWTPLYHNSDNVFVLNISEQLMEKLI